MSVLKLFLIVPQGGGSSTTEYPELEDSLFEIFKNEFYSFKEVEYALTYLKEKVQELEAEDFEDSIV